MLLSFDVENWMSFKERAHFSMVATKERQHTQRVPRLTRQGYGVVPVAAIYGGNASGKSNFLSAISFVKYLVLRGTQDEHDLIPVVQYKLSAAKIERPSSFSITILADEQIYEFSFAVTAYSVISEKLVQINPSSDYLLYERDEQGIKLGAKHIKNKALEYAALGTRHNQLFLTNSVSQRISTFKDVSDWFRDNLRLITPEAAFAGVEKLLDKEHMLHHALNSYLPLMDTGIKKVDTDDIPFADINIPMSDRPEMEKRVRQGSIARLTSNTGEQIVCSWENGEIAARRLVTFHSNDDGTLEKFMLSQESDGTRRLIDLIPAFAALAHKDSSMVFLIDEIDRSLHSLLISQLLEVYLSRCSPTSRSQLILTTHNLQLMDQDLFRRDEMWVTERSDTSGSRLTAMSEFKDIRYDKDIRKSYLLGRMGGIPDVDFDTSLLNSYPAEVNIGN